MTRASVLVLVLLAGCGSKGSEALRSDTGGELPSDAGKDAGADAGPREDATAPRMDAAARDADAPDAVAPDADAPDAVAADAQAPDAGPPGGGCCMGAIWEAAGGDPASSCVPWTLRGGGAPAIGPGGVTFATAQDGDNLYYEHTAPIVAAANQVQIRFRMRLVSSSAAAPWRAGASVLFAFGPAFEKGSLYIADGEIFLLAAENTRGMAAAVATTDAMHDYVITVDRTTSAITVSRDGVQVLTGTMFVNPGDNVTDRILWGDVSSVAHGESIWESFEHDAWSGCSTTAWAASEQITPDADCPAWTAIDTAPADPALASSGLTLATASDAENLGYVHEMLVPSTNVRMTFRMRLVSSAAAAQWRAGAGVTFAFGPMMQKGSLYIEDGAIFLLSAENTRGMSANVPTTDALHDYAIDVDTASGAVAVSYDGAALVTGTLFTTPGDTVTDRILWGDVSSVAHGESIWASFNHDALASCGP